MVLQRILFAERLFVLLNLTIIMLNPCLDAYYFVALVDSEKKVVFRLDLFDYLLVGLLPLKTYRNLRS